MKNILIWSLIVGLTVYAAYFSTKVVTSVRSMNARAEAAEEEYEEPVRLEFPDADYIILDRIEEAAEPEEYRVYQKDRYMFSFREFSEAVEYASALSRSAVVVKSTNKWVWDNHPPYHVFTGGEDYSEYDTFAGAVRLASLHESSYIYYRKNNSLVWTNAEPLAGRAMIEAPLICQLPELRRGCEVVSLAMLLNYKGLNADKMELASRVKKNDEPYRVVDGVTYFGDPNDGFVGDMYSLGEHGLGVYHGPVHELLTEYLPYSSLDLTGCDFKHLLYFLESGSPVWVIINTTYAKLPESRFFTWQTPNGIIKITYYEHSVLLTGYDDRYVYFNDPLNLREAAPIDGFIEAWEQMGRQAITVVD